MFDWLKNAVNNAVKTVKKALGGSSNKPAPKPAPKPAAKPIFKKIPKISFPKLSVVPGKNTIAPYWNNGRLTPAQRAANSRASANLAAVQRRNAAIAAENRRKAAQRAAERLRMKQVLKFNKLKMAQLGKRAKAADKIRGIAFRKEYNKAWYGKEDPSKFDKIKREYYEKAIRSFNQNRDNNRNVFSWLTGNDTAAARDFAQKQLEELQKKETKRYDGKLNGFLKEQARRKAEIEKKKFSTREEFDKAVAAFSKWENSKISDLEYTRAATTGLAEGYDKKSKSKNRAPLPTIGGWFTDTVAPAIANNGLFKYTLGSGDKNAPSIVTAPSRLINAAGNLWFNDKRYYHGGKVKTGKAKDWGQAWRQSYDQRNFNIKPAEKNKINGQNFEQWYKSRDLSQWKSDIDAGRIPEEKVKKLYKKAFDSQVKNNEFGNNAVEFLADPLFLAGGAAKLGGKGVSAGASWASRAARATKTGTAFFKGLEKAKNSKGFKWLTAEHKTPEQRLGDALTDAKVRQREIQQKLLPRINAWNKRAAAEHQIDASVLDDLSKLTDKEARILQRMQAGKFSFRDSVALRDIKGVRYAAPIREKLQDINRRWTDFTEKMKLADNVGDTRVGRGGYFYSPRTVWLEDAGKTLDDYSFRMAKKHLTWKRPQSAQDLYSGALDRVLTSNMQNWHRAGEASRRAAAKSEAGRLGRVYKDEMRHAREAAGVEEAFKATRTFKARAGKLLRQPTSLWKKSVLKYRPAWTVNNVLYNTQAGVLAGGTRSLFEQARLLRPKNWRKAMDEVPANVKADLTGELPGKGRLNRFYNGVENWSRVSAFRAAKAKGLTDAEALKRVDKYLYNYKTKNWERPIKSVLPFWAWNKNLARASVQMPFDRPLAAKIYNNVDSYQQGQFDKEFEKVVPQLEKLGYTKKEINEIKKQQSKYYAGRLKVGNKWITTPFNAFSEKGLASFGINPYLAALGESGTGKDSFGREIGGTDSRFFNRLITKFPQAELTKKAVNAWRVSKGFDKPRRGWIGEPGSAGYGLTKEAQGYDKSKTNYVRSMDPRAKLGQDALAFLGVPRGLEFDKADLVERKTLQKLTDEYFSLDTKNMDFTTAEKKRNALFKKYGMTADDFYGGILSKYDTANTKRIKGLKATAKDKNSKLFDEYAAQPKGTRNLWATEKLRELNDAGYFDKNPFLASFDWVNPDSVARADRQKAYQLAKSTGDWSGWRKKYGDTRTQKSKDYELAKSTGDWSAYHKKYGFSSDKARAYQLAKSTGDWSAYHATYGNKLKESPFQFDGKYFKSQETMDRYKEGKFWHKYAAADPEERRRLIAENPQYNDRKDWTDADWAKWRAEEKRKLQKRARFNTKFATVERKKLAENKWTAGRFISSRKLDSSKRLTWA